MTHAMNIVERIIGREVQHPGWAPIPSRAGVLVEVDGRVLLMLARKHAGSPVGSWSIPKGRIDAGETPWEAALRELREECGLDLSDSSFLPQGIGHLDYVRKGKPVIMEVLHFRLPPTDLQHLLADECRLGHLSDEVAEARLMDLDEAACLISAVQAPLLEQVLAHPPGSGGLSGYPTARNTRCTPSRKWGIIET
jgi:8-oxo-dGTP pyrophosphatase MutT (NUDIX family)